MNVNDHFMAKIGDPGPTNFLKDAFSQPLNRKVRAMSNNFDGWRSQKKYRFSSQNFMQRSGLSCAPLEAASEKSKAINEIWHLEESRTKKFSPRIAMELSQIKAQKNQHHVDHWDESEKLGVWTKCCDFLIFTLQKHL